MNPILKTLAVTLPLVLWMFVIKMSLDYEPVKGTPPGASVCIDILPQHRGLPDTFKDCDWVLNPDTMMYHPGSTYEHE